jgi:radical SAM superfamily enzyme YgiQ (UPF0313 family)
VTGNPSRRIPRIRKRNRMNIGCVFTDGNYVSKMPSFIAIPFGLSYVASSLKAAGHEPRTLFLTPDMNVRDEVAGFIEEHGPRLFCLTAVTTQYPFVRDVAKTIKQIDSSIHVILGGHHATLNPNETVEEPYFDAICIGEGERAAVEYASRIERDGQPARINNLWIKSRDGKSIEKNPPDPFIQDLDGLPNIDRRMWDEHVSNKQGMHSLLLGRGCPYKCTYCSNHALARVSKGRYVRFRSPGKVIGELNEIVEYYPLVNMVFLEMETFAVNLEYAYEMCDLLERFNANRKKPMAFGANFAVTKNVVGNEELLKRLNRANFSFINIGLESGSEKIRNEILKRPGYSNRDFIAFCRTVKKHGININLNVLIGIPGETVRDFRETAALVRECAPQSVCPFIFYPYPGTELYLTAKEMGLFTEHIADPSLERRRAVLDLPDFSKKQIQREYLLFDYHVYKGRKPLMQILAPTLIKYRDLHPGLYALYQKIIPRRLRRQIRELVFRRWRASPEG